MSIYNLKKENENYEKSEDEIFKESMNNYKDTIIRIIQQKDSKEPFLEINYVNEIINSIQNNKAIDLNQEIDFIETEFTDLGKQDYIKNYLLDDLINFSKIKKISNLLNGIINFIEIYNKIK